MNITHVNTARPSQLSHRLYIDVLVAALAGGEDDVRAALALLDESQLSRLRNAMRNVADLAEARRKQLWRQR